MRSERAISDALGFVLVFGIIVSTISVVYVGGFNAIDNARQFERMNNAERAFEVFADNVDDLTQRGAPSRSTEIKLAEASLLGGPTHEIEVNVTRAGAHAKNSSIVIEYRPIIYESRTSPQDRMIYELGATLRASAGGTTMSTDPPWILEDHRVVVPVVQTVHAGGSNITGSTTVNIRTSISGKNVLITNTSKESDVWMNVSTPRAEAWRDYMEAEGATCGFGPADVANCRMTEVEVVYVVNFRINFKFE